MEYYVEYRPGTAWNERKNATYRWMECKKCGDMSKVSQDTTAVTCPTCVQEGLYEQFGGPDVTLKKSSGRPRGWKWMAVFVDRDGTVYHKGIEQPDLKGTIEPSKIKDKGNRLTKKDKEKIKLEAGRRLYKLKKEYQKLRWKKDKKSFDKNIKYESRILAGKFPRKFNAEEYWEKNY
jgi:ribosomal protein S27E|tara:strand:- start:2893 stop:3423 length:531 start_codon:yes stop_codon:yes gene_type:complete